MRPKHFIILSFGLLWSIKAFADFSQEEFFTILKKGEYAIISAGRNMNNPADKILNDQQISTRTLQLENEIKAGKFKYQKVTGHYMALEESFFISISKLQEKTFTNLGEKFKQESIIVGSKGLQKMIYTTGKEKGLAHVGSGFLIVDESQKDFYTELITTDKKKIRFTLNFDFDRKCKNHFQVYSICDAGLVVK